MILRLLKEDYLVIYFLFLFIGISLYLGKLTLFLPLFFGIYLIIKYPPFLIKKQKHLYSYMFIFLFFYMISFFNKNLEYWFIEFIKLLSIFLYVIGIISLLERVDKKKIYRPIILINYFFMLYLIIFRMFLAFPTEEAVQILFKGSSYHIVAWYLFLLNSIVLIHLSEKTVLKLNLNKIIFLATLTLINFILLQGRTGILMGVLLFLQAIYLKYGKKLIIIILISIISYYLLFGFNFDINTILKNHLMKEIGGDAVDRGFALGPRQLIWGCYLDNLTRMDYLLGFNPSIVAGNCINAIGFNVRTESSFLKMISEIGIIGTIILNSYMIINIFRLVKKYPMLLGIFIAFISRITTGDFNYVTIYEWFPLYIGFALMDIKRNEDVRN